MCVNRKLQFKYPRGIWAKSVMFLYMLYAIGIVSLVIAGIVNHIRIDNIWIYGFKIIMCFIAAIFSIYYTTKKSKQKENGLLEFVDVALFLTILILLIESLAFFIFDYYLDNNQNNMTSVTMVLITSVIACVHNRR